MAKLESLGIRKIESLLYYVDDLERVRRFFLERLDFAETGVSSPELEVEGRQKSAVFQAGGVTMVICQPVGEGGRAWRWLRKHPEGVGTIVFQVEDIERTFKLLDERGGTMITDVLRFEDDGGSLAMFSDRPRRSATRPSASSSARAIARSSPGSSSTPSPSAARTSSASRRSITSRPTSRRWRRRCCGWSTCSASSASGPWSSTPATSHKDAARARG